MLMDSPNISRRTRILPRSPKLRSERRHRQQQKEVKKERKKESLLRIGKLHEEAFRKSVWDLEEKS
jgi:hypothetical protein